jgi:secreted trypsin-like serine protease
MPIDIAEAAQKALWAPGARATVTGWGTQFWPDAAALTVSDDLREVEVPVQSDADCANYAVMVTYDPRTMLCAGEQTGGKDACNGDSGGPLMSIGAGGAQTLVGVVSQGTGCGYPTQYGVYARVGEGPLRAWLDAVLPRPAPAVAQAASAAPKPAATPKAKAKATPKRKAKHKKKKPKRKRSTRKRR